MSPCCLSLLIFENQREGKDKKDVILPKKKLKHIFIESKRRIKHNCSKLTWFWNVFRLYRPKILEKKWSAKIWMLWSSLASQLWKKENHHFDVECTLAWPTWNFGEEESHHYYHIISIQCAPACPAWNFLEEENIIILRK